jgi:hypothetical protein
MILVNLGQNGAELLIGTIPGLTPTHESILAYRPNDFVSQRDWERAGRVVINDEFYDYVAVAQENIRFSGPTNAFLNGIDRMPHLSCCCSTMTQVRPEYGEKDQPATTKGSAHVIIDHGLYQSFPLNTGAIVSQLVFMDSPQTLTITGEITGSPTIRQLVLKPGAEVYVANTYLAALSGFVSHAASDFQAYYNMGNEAATCTLAPGDPPPNPCTPSAGPCLLKAKAVDRAKLTPEMKRVADWARMKVQSKSFVVDINCSGSQWP